MSRLNYEKPNMKLVSMENKEKVAAGNCWSEAASTEKYTWYYDYNGKGDKGYIVFNINSSCGDEVYNVDIRPDELDNDSLALAEKANLEANDTANGWVKQKFIDSGVIFDDITKVS